MPPKGRKGKSNFSPSSPSSNFRGRTGGNMIPNYDYWLEKHYHPENFEPSDEEEVEENDN